MATNPFELYPVIARCGHYRPVGPLVVARPAYDRAATPRSPQELGYARRNRGDPSATRNKRLGPPPSRVAR